MGELPVSQTLEIDQASLLKKCIEEANLDIDIHEDVLDACELNGITALKLASGEVSLETAKIKLFITESEAQRLVKASKHILGLSTEIDKAQQESINSGSNSVSQDLRSQQQDQDGKKGQQEDGNGAMEIPTSARLKEQQEQLAKFLQIQRDRRDMQLGVIYGVKQFAVSSEAAIMSAPKDKLQSISTSGTADFKTYDVQTVLQSGSSAYQPSLLTGGAQNSPSIQPPTPPPTSGEPPTMHYSSDFTLKPPPAPRHSDRSRSRSVQREVVNPYKLRKKEGDELVPFSGYSQATGMPQTYEEDWGGDDMLNIPSFMRPTNAFVNRVKHIIAESDDDESLMDTPARSRSRLGIVGLNNRSQLGSSQASSSRRGDLQIKQKSNKTIPKPFNFATLSRAERRSRSEAPKSAKEGQETPPLATVQSMSSVPPRRTHLAVVSKVQRGQRPSSTSSFGSSTTPQARSVASSPGDGHKQMRSSSTHAKKAASQASSPYAGNTAVSLQRVRSDVVTRQHRSISVGGGVVAQGGVVDRRGVARGRVSADNVATKDSKEGGFDNNGGVGAGRVSVVSVGGYGHGRQNGAGEKVRGARPQQQQYQQQQLDGVHGSQDFHLFYSHGQLNNVVNNGTSGSAGSSLSGVECAGVEQEGKSGPLSESRELSRLVSIGSHTSLNSNYSETRGKGPRRQYDRAQRHSSTLHDNNDNNDDAPTPPTPPAAAAAHDERSESAFDRNKARSEVNLKYSERSQMSSDGGLASLRQRAREYSENIRRKRMQEAKKRESRPQWN